MAGPVHGRAERQPAVHGHRWPDFQLRADPQLRTELDYCVPLGIPHSLFLGWSDADRGYALAWQANKRATCPGCGTRADEWADDEDAYISDHTTCEGCARLAEEQTNNLERRPDGEPRPGQKVHLVPGHLYQPSPPPGPAPEPPDDDEELPPPDDDD